KLQEETRRQAEAMLRERQRDPAAYVMGQPTVAAAFAAAEQDADLVEDALAARLAAQAAMGLPVEVQRILTREESAGILSDLERLPPSERAAALRALGVRYGEAAGPVAAVLMEAGLTPLE